MYVLVLNSSFQTHIMGPQKFTTESTHVLTTARVQHKF